MRLTSEADATNDAGQGTGYSWAADAERQRAML